MLILNSVYHQRFQLSLSSTWKTGKQIRSTNEKYLLMLAWNDVYQPLKKSFDTDMRTFQVRIITVNVTDRFGILKQKHFTVFWFLFFFDGFFSCTQTNFPVYSAPFQWKCYLVKPTQMKIYGRDYFVRKNPPTNWTSISFVADYKTGNA